MKIDITGIGNSIIDIIYFVENEFLVENNLVKGSMSLISEKTANFFLKLNYKKIQSGGSVANSIITLANMDINTGFISSFSNDEYGKIFCNEFTKSNVNLSSLGELNSISKSFIFVTPDGQRTMATYLTKEEEKLFNNAEDIIRDSKMLFLEGYLWDRSNLHNKLIQYINICKKNNNLLTLSLSDAFIVKKYSNLFLSFIEKIDFIVCNKAEFNALLKVVKLSNLTENKNLSIIVTREFEPTIIINSTNYEEIKVDKVSALDSTGAGDVFAAGFLFGIINNKSLNKSVKIGNSMAKLVLKKIGARLSSYDISSVLNLI